MELSSTYRIVVTDDFLILKNPQREKFHVKTGIYCYSASFALSATVASAQAPQPVPPAAAPGPVVKVLPRPPANAATVTNWHKQSVYDPSDAKVGEITDVLVDRDY